MTHKKLGMAMAMIGGLVLIPQQAKADFDLGRMAETVGTMVIADRLGIDPGIALAASIATNESVYGLTPVYALAPYTSVSPVIIYGERRRGWGWDRICTYHKIPRRTYTTLYNNHQFDSDYVWYDEFSTRYNVPRTRLQRLRQSGYTWPEISRGVVASQRGGWALEDVLYNYRTHNYWGRPGWNLSISIGSPYIVPIRTYRSSYLPVAVYHRINWSNPYGNLNTSIWRGQRPPIAVHWARQSIVRSPRTIIINNRKTVVNYRPITINFNKPVKIVTNGRVRYAKAQTRVGAASIWNVKPGSTLRVGSTTITTPNHRAQPMVRRPGQKPPVKRPNWPANKPHPPIRPGYPGHKPAPKGTVKHNQPKGRALGHQTPKPGERKALGHGTPKPGERKAKGHQTPKPGEHKAKGHQTPKPGERKAKGHQTPKPGERKAKGHN